MIRRLVDWCVRHHVATTIGMVASTLLIASIAALVVWRMPDPGSVVDTDPENMLPGDEPVRVFHRQMKKEFALYDMLVVGVVNDRGPDYIFNPGTLADVNALVDEAKKLHGEVIGAKTPEAGVVNMDIISPSTVETIEQAGLGSISFDWLMKDTPQTPDEARAVREKAMRLPFMKGTLLSEDGKALAIYIPLTDKHLSYVVAEKLREKIATFTHGDTYHITGLPIAEDTFGVEMFKQMALSAPLAMLIIFILLFLFFRKFALIIAPLIVAMVSCVVTMALLVATGNTVHIMSSMIPIFIMPIAVLDSIHILSEFYDRYQESKDRATAIEQVMDSLFTPMLYTSLTTAVGFLSLGLTPIPPVQVFGIFIAVGVMVAWIWTITFVPASVMFISTRALENFGLTDHHAEEDDHALLTRVLRSTGRGTYRFAKPILLVVVLLVAGAVYGINRITINDNPVKWFEPSHPIREADRVLNSHFGGTYMAYLSFAATDEESPRVACDALLAAAKERQAALATDGYEGVDAIFSELLTHAQTLVGAKDRKAFFDALTAFADAKRQEAQGNAYDVWNEAGLFVSKMYQANQVFKDPAVLTWMQGLQTYLLGIKNDRAEALVGKSNSLADLVSTVYRELMEGNPEFLRIPDTRDAVANTLMQYENSRRPQDLAHFVRTDTYRLTSMWVQLKSGDNRDMQAVVKDVESYITQNPPPLALRHEWFGLTYINVIWQNKMVYGMLVSFLGSFFAVWFMMIILFRSALWGLLSMIPLLVTIGCIYGIIGLIGKDYDMPVAVLSALSLGMAVDYAIHFLSRSRTLYPQYGSWERASGPMFGEPARAITRNVIVIGVGFLPLLAAPLVPYQTVGVFIAAILLAAGVATLFILPSMIRLLEKQLFPQGEQAFACRCGTCFFAAVAGVATVALNIQLFLDMTWTTVSYVSFAAIVLAAIICRVSSRRESCRLPKEPTPAHPVDETSQENGG